jgi:hypothetical protein
MSLKSPPRFSVADGKLGVRRSGGLIVPHLFHLLKTYRGMFHFHYKNGFSEQGCFRSAASTYNVIVDCQKFEWANVNLQLKL